MPYDYTSLSPSEFEELARDLIQSRDKIVLESFKSGKDSGIDFRFSASQENDIVVQAKRYKDDFLVLYRSLKDNELPKVKKLNPKRYLLVTSVSLSPANKKKIKELFKGWIQNTKDIIGKSDLDNLIGLYPSIEEKNFKLWFSNTKVITKILNSKVFNQTDFEKTEIKKKLRVFVYNESFDKALSILEKKRHVIISGQPGIGKTTLAQMLAYYWLSQDYDDFIYVSSSIDEAYNLYRTTRKQVFLFDDFLGSNIIDEGLARNEDKRILSFISQIENSKNKILILTTREYILAQAKYKYPILGGERLFRSRVIIDLSQYTTLIRAKILYNHLFFSDLPAEYLASLLKDDKYLSIINHKNYSPRVIDLVLNEIRIWENVKPQKFYAAFNSAFEDVASLWKDIFENRINETSRLILVLIATSGQPLLVEDLEHSLANILSELKKTELLDVWGTAFAKSIHELEETFIKSEADTNGNVGIEFSNPSILDFLIEYIRERPKLLEKLIRGIAFANQLTAIYEIPKPDQWLIEMKTFKPIKIEGKLLDTLKKTVEAKFNSILPNSIVYKKPNSRKGFSWTKRRDNSISLLDPFIHLFDLTNEKKFLELILSRYKSYAISKVKLDEHFSSYVNFMYILRPHTQVGIEARIISFSKKAKTFNQIAAFSNMAQAFPREFHEFSLSKDGLDFSERCLPILQHEFRKTLFLALNSPTNDFMHRLIWKAEMERVCEEINFISRSLGLGVSLDSEYHKEFVREKMRQKDPNPDKVSTKSELEERIDEIVRDMFNTMIRP